MSKAAITFDLDLVDYLSGEDVDELDQAFPLFQNYCDMNPWLKSTWFVRIDNQLIEKYGAADFVFTKHKNKIDWLRNNGHEIGWHFHSFVKVNEKWQQNNNEENVVKELTDNYSIAKKYDLKLLRMGWTYHTNKTFIAAESFNLLADCSALPRPNYQWDMALRDWENTPQQPYFPSSENYKLPGFPSRKLLEFPITVTPIAAPYDTQKEVLRYINPCYHHAVFTQAMEQVNTENLNLLSHPYEYLKSKNSHALIAFNFETFIENIEWMKIRQYEFVTMGSMVNEFLLKTPQIA